MYLLIYLLTYFLISLKFMYSTLRKPTFILLRVYFHRSWLSPSNKIHYPTGLSLFRSVRRDRGYKREGVSQEGWLRTGVGHPSTEPSETGVKVCVDVSFYLFLLLKRALGFVYGGSVWGVGFVSDRFPFPNDIDRIWLLLNRGVWFRRRVLVGRWVLYLGWVWDTRD